MGSLRARLMARFYDTGMQRSEQLCLGSWRAELLAQASGEVLEIGTGTGSNLPYYPAKLKRLILSEPDRFMRQQLAKKLPTASARQLELTDWSADRIDLPDRSLDTIVCTLVLCSVADQQQVLAELFRLLRPGGQLLFLEHVIAESPGTIRWQRVVEPLWKCCAGNCHLTRDTAQAIAATGLQMARLSEADILGAPKIVRRTIRGSARKP